MGTCRANWHGRLVSAGLAVCVAMLGGCATAGVRLGVEHARMIDPSLGTELPPDWAGVPDEDLGACGPSTPLNEVIPDCPFGTICFTAACLEHDRCYSACGTTQADCDNTFFWQMVALCRQHYPEDQIGVSECYGLAYIYYSAVARYGAPYFDDTQATVCEVSPEAESSDQNLLVTAPASAIAAPFEDFDDDLLPDDWERAVGLDPADPADALEDPDGDGRVNLGELLAGTDPLMADLPAQ